MRFLKSNPIFSLLNSYLVDSPQPANISYMWNFGSLLGICLLIQILTGVFLAMHYTPNVELAFISVEHIMRDVNSGWFLRYTHANVASFFFLFLYFHTARGLYYSSYKAPRVLLWSIGVIILILTMATAFLGYNHSPKWFNVTIFSLLDFGTLPKAVASLGALHDNNFISFSSCLLLYSCSSISKKEVSKRNFCNNCTTVPHPRGEGSGKSSMYLNTSERLNTIIKELDLNPVFVFENLNLEKTKQEISKSTIGLSGVYMIINKISKDYYIGSASTNRFNARFTNHLIYFRGSKVVKLAVKKYKLENFAFIVLELHPHIITKENNKELLDLEDKYLKLFLPNYNILTEAGSSFGYKHTEVDRQKMKDIYTNARRDMRGRLNRGRKLLPETIDKIRASALKKGPMSEGEKKKCIANTRPVVLYNLNGTVYGKYTSILEAANAINCNAKTIRRSLKTEKKIVKRQWIVSSSPKGQSIAGNDFLY